MILVAVVYSTDMIDARLNAVVTALGATATLVLMNGASTLVSIPLANPAGVVSGGILTFTTPSALTLATGTGVANVAVILDSLSAVSISGLTVGIPLSGAEVIISNNLNSTLISAGLHVQLVAAQIVGS